MSRSLDEIRSHIVAMPFVTELGITVTSAAAGEASLAMPLTSAVAWNEDAFAGAFVGLLADVAAGAAALSVLPAAQAPMTMAVDLTLTGPTSGPRLRADARLASHNGNTLALTVVVHAEDDHRSTTCGVVLVSLRAVPLAR